jgi:hypothetical protein
MAQAAGEPAAPLAVVHVTGDTGFVWDATGAAARVRCACKHACTQRHALRCAF